MLVLMVRIVFSSYAERVTSLMKYRRFLDLKEKEAVKKNLTEVFIIGSSRISCKTEKMCVGLLGIP